MERLVIKRLALALLALALTGAFAFSLAYFEHRTHSVSMALGRYLVGTNEHRPATGRLWDVISSETEARSVLPDSVVADTLPSDLVPLVRNTRLTLHRIPESGLPGYLSIITEDISTDIRATTETGRLITGNRLHRLGRTLLASAAFDPSPFLDDARKIASRMRLDLPKETIPSTEPDHLDSSVVDTIPTLPQDIIAVALEETFVSVILEQKLAQLTKQTLSDWDAGHIQQLFVNRSLGNHTGEAYFVDASQPRLRFTVSTSNLRVLLNLPPEPILP